MPYNSTIIVKEKKCVSCGKPCQVFSKGRCKECANIDSFKKRSALANDKSKIRGLGTYQKVEGIVDSLQELIIDLDRVVSRYVRLAEMGKDHKCGCYTCSTRKDWKAMQCGHYINRQHLGLRWELPNLRVQCPNCNITLRGNIEVYAANLEREQKGIVEWLEETAREVAKPTKDELKQLLFHFQQKLKLVEQKLTA